MKITNLVGTLAFAAVLIFAPLSAQAATFIDPKDEMQQAQMLQAGQVIKNLYTAGNSLLINSETVGDIFAAGSNINLNGSVSEDANLAAGNIVVNSDIDGDARIASGDASLNGAIKGDALVAAGRILVTNKANISGDAYFGGGKIMVNGSLLGPINRISGQDVTINGPVTGQLTVYAETLTFGADAKVTGSVKYFGPKPAVITEGATVPTVEYVKMISPAKSQGEKPNAGAVFGLVSVILLVKVIAWFILTLILYKLFPRTAAHLVAATQDKFWKNVGVGVLFAVILPILALVALCTVIGYSSAFVLMTAYVLFWGLAAPLAYLTLGAWLLGKLTKKDTTAISVKVLLFGALTFFVLELIPIVGGVIAMILLLAAFGVLVRQVYAFSKAQ